MESKRRKGRCGSGWKVVQLLPYPRRVACISPCRLFVLLLCRVELLTNCHGFLTLHKSDFKQMGQQKRGVVSVCSLLF